MNSTTPPENLPRPGRKALSLGVGCRCGVEVGGAGVCTGAESRCGYRCGMQVWGGSVGVSTGAGCRCGCRCEYRCEYRCRGQGWVHVWDVGVG